MFVNYWKGRENPDENQCKVGFIYVLNDENELDLDIGAKIIEKLL